MEDKLRRVLRETAATPQRSLDLTELHARARRRRTPAFVSVMSAAVILATAMTAWLVISRVESPSTSLTLSGEGAGRGQGAEQPAMAPTVDADTTTTTAPGSTGNRYVPPTTIENGTARMPLTFLDGTRAFLSYPAALRVSELGVVVTGALEWTPADSTGASGYIPCCERTITVTYADRAQAYSGQTPIATYEGAGSRHVQFYNSTDGTSLDYLVYQFGPWMVEVFDYPTSGKDVGRRMTDEERSMLARSIGGRTTEDGFLVLTVGKPVRLTMEEERSRLAVIGESGTQLEIVRGTCTPTDRTVRRNGDEFTASVCSGGLRVMISGSSTFVEAADDLQIDVEER